MFKYPTSLKSDKYPDFIKKSMVTKAFPKPVKVFPRIGLKNCEVALSSLLSYRSLKIKDMLWNINNAFDNIRCSDNNFSYDLETDIDDVLSMIDEFAEEEDYYNIKIIETKATQSYPKIMNGGLKFHTVKINKNRDFFDLCKQLIANIKKVKNSSSIEKYIKDIEKVFSSENKKIIAQSIFPSNRTGLKICFSSSDNKGYWDIATMSMRGLSSCMRWGTKQSKTLVGSIVDPYTGVIYITDGTNTKYGKKMLARAVVRFVATNGNKPAILIEPVYITNNSDNEAVLLLFKSFIEKRVSKTYNILSYNKDEDFLQKGVSIPLTNTTEELYNLTEGYDNGYYPEDNGPGLLPYRDSGIEFKKINKFYNPNKIIKKK